MSFRFVVIRIIPNSKVITLALLKRSTFRSVKGYRKLDNVREESERSGNLELEGLEASLYTELGPVVRSIVSLTSLLRGQLVKCFTTL